MDPIDLRQKVSGKYSFEIVNKVTGESRALEETADNLLLISFFREAVSTSGQVYMNNIVVGSGNTPPTELDVNLESFVAASRIDQGPTMPNVVNSTVYPRYATRSIKKRFNGTDLNNIPLSEVGLAILNSPSANANATSPLGSRALIRDPLGNPTSIVVNSDEFLDVTYSLTTYALDGVTGSFDINILGAVETFNYEIRPEYMLSSVAWSNATSASSGAYLTPRVFPAGTSGTGASSVSSSTTFQDPSGTTYASPPPSDRFTSYKTLPVWDEVSRTGTGVLSLPLNNGNYPSGIGSIVFIFTSNQNNAGHVLGVHRMVLDKPLMKTEEHIFEFPVTIGLANATPPAV